MKESGRSMGARHLLASVLAFLALVSLICPVCILESDESAGPSPAGVAGSHLERHDLEPCGDRCGCCGPGYLPERTSILTLSHALSALSELPDGAPMRGPRVRPFRPPRA
jgi:hypothetical protein